MVSLLALVLMVSLPSTGAAARILPPSHELQQEYRLLAVVEFEGAVDTQHAEFSVVESLRGYTEERLILRPSNRQQIEGLSEGERYLVGYTFWVERRFPATSGRDPEGPRILDLPGVGSAIFPAEEGIRKFLTFEAEGEVLPDWFDRVAALLERNDNKLQRLAVAELTRREWFGSLSSKQADRIVEFASDLTKDGSARLAVLSQGDLLTPTREDWRLAIAESAALALRARAPETWNQAVEQAFGTDLTPATRRSLERLRPDNSDHQILPSTGDEEVEP